ncbi:hypothetical protein JST97_04125 [bacterium]|nr:hypothetical protein [bacterium]
MVEIQSKNGATYLRAYQQMVERVKELDQSSADQSPEVGLVTVDQVIQTGASLSQEDTRLILKGSLQSGPVLAPSGPISLEAIPLEQYTHQPATKVAFRPNGGQLEVVESWFAPGKAEGQQRSFQVGFSNQAISNVREEAIQRTLPGAADPAVQRALGQLGSQISNLAFTIRNPQFEK